MRIQNQEPIWEERCHNFPQLQERLYQIHRQMIPNIEKKGRGRPLYGTAEWKGANSVYDTRKF